MGKIEIEQFLTHLDTKLHVSPIAQNQVFNAPLFLHEQVKYFFKRSKYSSIKGKTKKAYSRSSYCG